MPRVAQWQGQEPTPTYAENLRDLLGDAFGKRIWLVVLPHDNLGGAEHTLQVAGPPIGSGVLPVSPQGDLRDSRTDYDEEHCRLNVVGVVDRQSAIGFSQEEVEAQPARDGRHDAGHPHACAGRSDHQ